MRITLFGLACLVNVKTLVQALRRWQFWAWKAGAQVCEDGNTKTMLAADWHERLKRVSEDWYAAGDV